jgi:hypothetical protein
VDAGTRLLHCFCFFVVCFLVSRPHCWERACDGACVSRCSRTSCAKQ